jgi:hypothetical protein
MTEECEVFDDDYEEEEEMPWLMSPVLDQDLNEDALLV